VAAFSHFQTLCWPFFDFIVASLGFYFSQSSAQETKMAHARFQKRVAVDLVKFTQYFALFHEII
jgi:hypothetical protein